MNSIEYTSNSAEETQRIGEQIGNALEKGNCIALHGDLGSGKTTFTQGLAKGLGITTHLSSPTFIIMRAYMIAKFKTMFYHVDLYRTKDENDAKGIGLDEILLDNNSIVVIEWPEKISQLIPEKTKHIYFEYLEEDKRRIKVENS